MKLYFIFNYHTDHIQGAKALIEDHSNQKIEIYAHSTQSYESKRFGRRNYFFVFISFTLYNNNQDKFVYLIIFFK